MSVPLKWLNFVRRVFGLQPGRYVILLTINDDSCAYEVMERKKTEK
ncbi:MAG: hypothetical protein IT328_04640 [Caldilineaceae bacterium]|nr:hypothetical protein [Caldilineaceae bacterium]